MHISAYKNAQSFYESLCKSLPDSTKVVDIGSMNVNGSLKPIFSRFQYIGVDTHAGPNVDVICTGRKYPFEDNSVDIILSTSCFEHDDMFWVTFLEMARICRPGGLLYINVPSEGPWHGYPGDSWRFYKDAWKSLQMWASLNSINLMILESYIDTTCQFKNNVGIFMKPPADYIFYKSVDSGGHDIQRLENKALYYQIKNSTHRAFNTLGYIKSFVKFPLTTSPWLKEQDGIYIRKDVVKCAELQANLKLSFDKWEHEYPEQCMSYRLLTGSEKIIELGGNIGRNTLIMASILQNQSNLVSLECDSEIAKKLQHNRDQNNMKFHIEPSALSKRKLIQKGWETKPSDTCPEGWSNVSTITWDELQAKYSIEFDTLVADCEGALYYILQDMPEILTNINLIMMENDYWDFSHKQKVDEILKAAGFTRIYHEAGGWGPCKEFFYEAWKKV